MALSGLQGWNSCTPSVIRFIGNLRRSREAEIGDRILASGMALGVVLGRADVDSGVAAGAFFGPAGFAIAVGGLVGSGLIWRSLGWRKSCCQYKKSGQETDAHGYIVALSSAQRTR